MKKDNNEEIPFEAAMNNLIDCNSWNHKRTMLNGKPVVYRTEARGHNGVKTIIVGCIISL